MPYGARSIPRVSRKHKTRLSRSVNRMPLVVEAAIAAAAPADYTVAEITAIYTMLNTDGFVHVTGGAGGFTVTLHALPLHNVFYFKNSSAGAVTLDPAGSIQIDGASTYVIATGLIVTVVWNGTAYYVVRAS